VRPTHLNVGLWPPCIRGNILLNENVTLGDFLYVPEIFTRGELKCLFLQVGFWFQP